MLKAQLVHKITLILAFSSIMLMTNIERVMVKLKKPSELYLKMTFFIYINQIKIFDVQISAGVGYDLYVVDIRVQETFAVTQPIKVGRKFVGVVPNNIKAFALVLTNDLVSVSSDEEGHFDWLYPKGFHYFFYFFHW